jgi:hypothetical protein
MGMVHGVVLVEFAVPVLVRARLRSGKWSLWIIRPAIRPTPG